MSIRGGVLAGLLLLLTSLPAFSQTEEELHFGIYADREPAIVADKYQALNDYLSSELPDHKVIMHILSGKALQEAVRNNRLDLLLLNPNLFEVIRHEHSLTGAVATLEKTRNDIPTHSLGGVIFTLAESKKTQTLQDLQNKTIAIPSRTNTGAYRVPLYELKKEKIDTGSIRFIETGTNDSVVEAVLNKQAQVGFVRTGILEEFYANQRLTPEQIKIIHKQNLPSFPYIVSTALYPEWPFVVMSHVPSDIQRQVIAALFQLNKTHPAAQKADIAGFIPPLSYLPLQKMLQELRLYPYDQIPEVTPYDIFEQYKYPVASLILALFLLTVTLAWVSRLNLHLKEAISTVQKQQRTLHELVSGTRAGTWEWHIQSGEVTFNERWAEMLGYTLRELEPLSIQTWEDLVHPEDLKKSEALLKKHFKGESDHYECEARMRHKDGHWIWVYDSGRVHKWAADGSPQIISGTHVDITHIKEKERLLRLTAQRDEAMLQLPAVADKLSDHDLMRVALEKVEALTESSISFVHLIHDETEIELLAWSKDTVENHCHAEFKRHYPVAQAGIWADAIRTQSPVVINDYPNYEHKSFMPEGHAPLKRFASVPVIENQQVVMIAGIGNKAGDYTDTDIETLQLLSNEIWRLVQRKKNQLRLEQAANVFNTAQEGILITDKNGHIQEANQAFSRITGYSLEEIKGHTPSLFSSGKHSADFYKKMWKSLTIKGHWSGEIWNRRKNGEIYPQKIAISSNKDTNGHILQYIALLSDITSEKQHLQELEHLAHHDKLTGLPNRSLLSDRINQALKRCERNRLDQAVVFIDLDGFKAVNDRHGHDAGDELLKTLAGRFKENLREEDTIARLGGDEFVALIIDLPNVKELERILERLLTAAHKPVQFADQRLNVSASLGAYVYNHPETSSSRPDADQLLREADQAMYQAKMQGKNRYVITQSPFAT